MLGSIKIGKVLGITVRVHWLFLPVAAAAWVWSSRAGDPRSPFGTGVLQLALWVAVLFGVVFLHELGHSLVARHFGIRVLDITLWPLGGMARMSEIPEDAKVESLIAIAGPLVNFALAALGVPGVRVEPLLAAARGALRCPSDRSC